MCALYWNCDHRLIHEIVTTTVGIDETYFFFESPCCGTALPHMQHWPHFKKGNALTDALAQQH